jgi:hypothetical protein
VVVLGGPERNDWRQPAAPPLLADARAQLHRRRCAILFLGIGLALGNWISLAVLLVAVSIVYGYRVDVEERALVAVIGDPYRRYMSRTKRFVPFLF